MPVYLDESPGGHNRFSRTQRDSTGELQVSAARCIHVGLINNMPDGALQATERQFLTLLGSASDNVVVRLSLYSLPGIPRTGPGLCHANRFYSGIEALWDRRLDGLIVTGAEPHATKLEDEPYWGSLARVAEWAESNAHSTIWSCLAAHAAVLHTDGIVRRRLSGKRFGVFECARASDHHLTEGVAAPLGVPHSRWNDIPEKELTDRGYRVLLRSGDAGADTFVKRRKSLFVFFQGHPEYDANTLLLEYRRDVGRYLRHESTTYPPLPRGYFGRDTIDLLTALRERTLSNRRIESLAAFPTALAEGGLSNLWRAAAVLVYRNWLAYLWTQKERRSRERSVRNLCASGGQTYGPLVAGK